ncbi:MAG: TMEM175 family protein, partial [Pseudonocardia sp.]
ADSAGRADSAGPADSADSAGRGDSTDSAGVGRLLAFTDGVFAIALTILVLDLDVPPDLATPELVAALRDQLPNLFAAALSFAVIGRIWLGHHAVLAHVVRADPALLALNTVFLGPLVLLPFVTKLLAEYGDIALAVIAYSATVDLLLIGLLALWVCANRSPRTDGRVSRDEFVRRAGGLAGSVAAFTVAVPVALVSPHAAILCWLLAIVPVDGLTRRIAAAVDRTA